MSYVLLDYNFEKVILSIVNLHVLEHVYMRPKVNSNRFEMSNRLEMSFRLNGNLHGDFTAVTFQTIARLYCTCANNIFKLMQTQLMLKSVINDSF